MRQALRVLGWSFWSLLSLDIVVAVLDWSQRWEWLKEFMASHPSINSFVHTPFVFLALLILGFAFITAERRLKQPKLIARLVNLRITADWSTTPIGAVFAAEEKKPGWDQKELDWEWFAEIHFANDADTPTTLEEIRVRAWFRPTRWSRKVLLSVKPESQIGDYKIDMAVNDRCEDQPFNGKERYRKLDDLVAQVKNVHLTRGIGHRGWLHFHIKRISQRNLQKIKTNIWLVDALQGKHKVHANRDFDRTRDRGFYIFRNH